MSEDKKHPDPNELDFEQALQQIEEITRQLESGNLTLEESLRVYEQAVALLRRCYALLKEAETRVEMLVGVDEAGNPLTTPFPLRSQAPENAFSASVVTDRSPGTAEGENVSNPASRRKTAENKKDR